MENAKMGINGNYRTSDLYIAAWLLSKGLELKDIDRPLTTLTAFRRYKSLC